MTRSDVTALSGDPQSEMSFREWAHEMRIRLDNATPAQQRAWFREMTTEEADMVIAAYREAEGGIAA